MNRKDYKKEEDNEEWLQKERNEKKMQKEYWMRNEESTGKNTERKIKKMIKIKHKESRVCLVGFHGISTIESYLMPNPLYTYILNI